VEIEIQRKGIIAAATSFPMTRDEVNVHPAPQFGFQKFMSKSRVATFDTAKIFPSTTVPNFKEYPRLQKITLPAPSQSLSAYLGTCLESRHSPKRFRKESLSSSTLSDLLQFSCGQQRNEFRNAPFARVYPSAGAKYPIEGYPILLNSPDLPVGVYHYSVRNHNLSVLLAKDVRKALTEATSDKRLNQAMCVVVLTSIFGRTAAKYGERGFRYILLECGHIAQNFALVSAALNIGCLVIGGFIDGKICELLDIDNETEFPLYLLAFGGI
jgi:SagB-type dehydrogenase family enzyme